jgi:ABC-type lipoprotein export system ATPase subunit/GNAT superfamily N-acetyltransferase
MFDVPAKEKTSLSWQGDFPIEGLQWNVGLIVGPSGAGKSTILRKVFGDEKQFDWQGKSVVDDFDQRFKMDQIADVCQAVGFNTIPAWLRPYHVLSNGERFRVEMARRVLETQGIIVVDEFTSVVDRQVAQIGAHAIQKRVRKDNRQFVAATCHYDVIEWLQPDWIFEPVTMSFTRRSLRRRPTLNITIERVPWSTWKQFAPFHYLTGELHRAAQCFGLFVDDRLAAFAGMLHFPHPIVKDIIKCSRLVTLPDWQGLGLAMVLVDKLGSMYKALGKRMRTYPAHPALIRSFDKSAAWSLEAKPGLPKTNFTGIQRKLAAARGEINKSELSMAGFGERPCAVFQFAGPAADRALAHRVINAAI